MKIKVFTHDPAFFLSNSTGGAITRVLLLEGNWFINIAVIFVFPSPTTSEIKTPPYSSKIFFALRTACSWYSNLLNPSGVWSIYNSPVSFNSLLKVRTLEKNS